MANPEQLEEQREETLFGLKIFRACDPVCARM